MSTPSDNDSVRAQLRDAFMRIGFDIDVASDMQQMRENHQWISEQRAKGQRNKQQAVLFIWSVAAALCGAIATTIGTFLLKILG